MVRKLTGRPRLVSSDAAVSSIPPSPPPTSLEVRIGNRDLFAIAPPRTLADNEAYLFTCSAADALRLFL